MKKISLIIFLVIFGILLCLFLFRSNIEYYILEKRYSNIEHIDKTLEYDLENNLIGDNIIHINNFNIALLDFEYSEKNELKFSLKFSNLEPLNSVGYILRIYNESYCLGDRFLGKVSISPKEWLIYQDIFYKKTFNSVTNKNLLNAIQNFSKQVEILEEDNSLLHIISIDLPKEFIISDKLNILLFDMNYQNIGDKNFYKLVEPYNEIEYIVNNI